MDYTHHCIVVVEKTDSKRGSPGVVLAAEEKGIASVAVVEEVEEHSMTEYRERQ